MPELQLNSHQTVNEFKQKFSDLFPYLKIEFYHKNSDLLKQSIESNMKIAELSSKEKDNNITFISSMSVDQVENILLTTYGLIVHIFRKSGSVWLKTTATKNWSLERQNQEGRTLDQFFNS